MKLRGFSYSLVATAALVSTAFQPCVAQTAQSLNPQSTAPLAASASTAVPALVPFSGLITEPDGKPVSGETAITFLIFKDQEGGEPLFAETQAVTPDAGGRYRVQLGATLANGLPVDLFATGEARWLEVQAAGQPPEPRALMASVPYAFKAADSATLGGLPASAFVLAGSKAAADLAPAAVSAATMTASAVTTTGGTTGYVSEFTSASTIADSPIFVLGADVGIGTITPTATLDVNGTALISGAMTANGGATLGGTLELAPTGTATPSAADNSQLLKLYTSAYNSASKAVLNPRFEWQAEVTGNDTASPSATLNLLSSTTAAGATETGFHFNANGTITFVKGQTFPGTGNGTITAVTAGTGLTGGGTAGNVTLNLDTTKVVTGLIAGTGLIGGGTGGNVTLNIDTAQIPQFTAPVNDFFGNMIVGGRVTSSSLSIVQPAGLIVTPVATIQADEDGVARNAAQQLVIQGATDPTQQLLIGYEPQKASGGGYATIQATWENVQNTGLLLQPNGGCVCIRTGNQQFQNPLVIGQGQGGAVADDWSTYSSRRFKTDIQTLPDALAKVEKLRGVSYTLKANGKHEIGVIAEEVGVVVPEVVTYEKNGVDARSVDYTRLTALLIEATKEQQTLIQQQQKQIKTQQMQIRAQQMAARLQQAQIARLASQMRTVQAVLNDSDHAGSQARTVAQLTMTH
jgi:hypothetical protein